MSHRVVLIVDDDPVIRLGLKDALEAEEFYVVEAEDAFEALRALAEVRAIEIMISDVMMPGKDGLELARFAAAQRFPFHFWRPRGWGGLSARLARRSDPRAEGDRLALALCLRFRHAAGETHFAVAGLSWKIGGRLFLRPGLGVALHPRGSRGVANGSGPLCSRVLFEPELGIGYQVSNRVAIEATLVHVSNAQLLSRQNPGWTALASA